jgi:hypothetical protein
MTDAAVRMGHVLIGSFDVADQGSMRVMHQR